MKKQKKRIPLASCDKEGVNFHPLPKKYWWIWEILAEEIIQHELVHLTIFNLEGESACRSFDKICPTIQSWLSLLYDLPT